MYDSDDPDPLCCCEYFDRNDERNHILACCCNCTEFDESFDRLICCRRVTRQQRTNMLLTFQDRLRIPWRGGAKRIACEAVLPVLLLPILTSVAAINMFSTIAVCIATPAILMFVSYRAKKSAGGTRPRTKFFFMWSLTTVVYLWIIFEIWVPVLELLPEENVALIALTLLSLLCFLRARKRAPMDFLVAKNASRLDDSNMPDTAAAAAALGEEHTSLLINDPDDSDALPEIRQPNVCLVCRKYMPPKTFHCVRCQVCISKRDHHNIWMDCCVGESNHRYFLGGCFFGICALTFGSNMTLTAICHPILLAEIFGTYILLPNDCSDVYDEYGMALCFIAAIYAAVLALALLLILLHQIFLISTGVTCTEWKRRGLHTNRRSICHNWRIFCTWYS